MCFGISLFYLHEHAILVIKSNKINHSLKASELAFRINWHWIKIYSFKNIDECHYITNIRERERVKKRYKTLIKLKDIANIGR